MSRAHAAQSYRGRPQPLLFLAISYAVWASVALRWIMEFIEQAHALTGLVSVLLLIYGVLLGLEPLITGRSTLRGHLYMLVQTGLTMAAVLLFYEIDFFALLLVPLAGQAVFIFPRRTAALWVAILLLANIAGQIQQFGWPGALPFLFLYGAAILFVAAFSLITIQAEASRRRSEALLTELQDAHRQLQAYAGQAEELAVAQERNRVARELHDSVAQTLYGLTLQSEAAARKLALGQVDAVAEDLQFFRASTQQTLQETRLLIFELRPPILDEVGLPAALRARVNAVESRSGIRVRVNVEDVGRLPTDVETGLYRIAQETLNNILKHAHADEVALSLRRSHTVVTLEITDNGVGFNADEAWQSGYGIKGMGERAEQLGATLAIVSRPDKGTRVTVEVPI